MAMISKLFNENTTIRTQLFVSFILILFLVTGITLGICYGLLFKMGDDAYATSESTIAEITWQSLNSYAKELSLSLAQQLSVISSSLYAKLLNEYISANAQQLRKQVSYREYYFNDPNCVHPDCPLDFGSLQGFYF